MATIPTGQKFHTVPSNVVTQERGSALANSQREIYTMQDIIDTVGGLGGTSYVYVAADGNSVENAAQLQAAYTTAQSMSPSASNRITILAAPGNYDFGSSPFVMNTQYIDLVSLDGNRSIIFNSANSAGTISITANGVFVYGVDVVNKIFTIADNLNKLKIENCKGGDYSFGYGLTVSGTFTNCIGNGASFAGGGIASGTFINCIGGPSISGTGCFGGGFGGVASGTFTNCIAQSSAFGGGAGTASGTFNNCSGSDFSFGGFFVASGVFNNCIGSNSFGTYATLSGKLYYCRLTSGTFETVTAPGITRLCIDGNNVENNQG